MKKLSCVVIKILSINYTVDSKPAHKFMLFFKISFCLILICQKKRKTIAILKENQKYGKKTNPSDFPLSTPRAHSGESWFTFCVH